MKLKLGNYYLGQDLGEIEEELEEISEAMYRILPKTFKDEKIFKGREITFLNHSWHTIIGITNKKIYKIALFCMSGEEDEIIFNSALKYFIKEFGEPSERKYHEYSFFYIWDTEWGNIVLERKGEIEGKVINIFLTSNASFKSLPFFSKAKIFLRAWGQRLNLFGKKIGVIWSPLEHSDDENLRWCWLRAVEWGKWPLFITQPIIPILFLFFSWWQPVIAIVILTWLWAFIRYKYVNITLADLGPLFVYLKWPVSVSIGIYFLIKHNYFLAVISTFWPLITLMLQSFSPPTQIGKLQKIFMDRLGYTRKIE